METTPNDAPFVAFYDMRAVYDRSSALNLKLAGKLNLYSQICSQFQPSKKPLDG